MSPTIFKEKDLRFYFFSREETRMHVHVQSSGGEAKFWLSPSIDLAKNYGLTDKELREAKEIIGGARG
ncbi:MAG: DUF4160 domain-containing protein [Vicinamibacteria bacterium]